MIIRELIERVGSSKMVAREGAPSDFVSQSFVNRSVKEIFFLTKSCIRKWL